MVDSHVALAVWSACAAAPPPPQLAVSIENAITRPDRHGAGARIRPLVLIFSEWSGGTPGVEANSYTGLVKAECTRTLAPAGEWNAKVHFRVTEEQAERTCGGEINLRLRIQGAIVHGWYDGAFSGIPMSGQPGAGLVFEHMYRTPHRGLLLWLPDLQRAVRGIVIWGNGANLDDRHAALREPLQAFADAPAHDEEATLSVRGERE